MLGPYPRQKGYTVLSIRYAETLSGVDSIPYLTQHMTLNVTSTTSATTASLSRIGLDMSQILVCGIIV